MRRRTGWRTLAGCAAILVTLSGCASVRPYEREYLADRIMNYDTDSLQQRHNRKWLEAREGSTGGAEGAGGGCACN